MPTTTHKNGSKEQNICLGRFANPCKISPSPQLTHQVLKSRLHARQFPSFRRDHGCRIRRRKQLVSRTFHLKTKSPIARIRVLLRRRLFFCESSPTCLPSVNGSF